MSRSIERLYHLAEADNVASILAHGLMSTERLVRLAGISEPAGTTLLRTHRPDNVRLSMGMVIRDQRPMPPAALARALEEGLEPADWYALLNSFVFLWPDRERLERQRRACGSRPQTLLTFDSAARTPYIPAVRGVATRRLARGPPGAWAGGIPVQMCDSDSRAVSAGCRQGVASADRAERYARAATPIAPACLH
jgi:hypothetical protein